MWLRDEEKKDTREGLTQDIFEHLESVIISDPFLLCG